MEKKTLVAYFSATGTTAQVARLIAEATGGDLFEIQPQQPYTAADLDWTTAASRSSKENADASARPALKKNKENIASYDTIYIGFPIWWDVAPKVINTFIEASHLEGKTVIPFATSGSSSISNSEKVLRETYPGLNWQKGKLLNGATANTVKKWINDK